MEISTPEIIIFDKLPDHLHQLMDYHYWFHQLSWATIVLLTDEKLEILFNSVSVNIITVIWRLSDGQLYSIEVITVIHFGISDIWFASEENCHITKSVFYCWKMPTTIYFQISHISKCSHDYSTCGYNEMGKSLSRIISTGMLYSLKYTTYLTDNCREDNIYESIKNCGYEVQYSGNKVLVSYALIWVFNQKTNMFQLYDIVIIRVTYKQAH